MMRLKNLLTLLILSGSRISVAAFSDGTSARYAFLALVATVLLAAVFVLLSSPTRGKEDAFELGSSFLLSGLPALAAIFSAALVIFQMDRNLCNLFRGCSWSFAFWIHTPNFIFSLVGNIFVFSATILAASFIAQLTKTMLRFRDGMVSGCFAFHSFLKSRRLKCALTVAVMIGWYAAVILFKFSLAARLLLAVAAAFLLAVLYLALPAPVERADRSISELGRTFLLAAAPALATLITVHYETFGLDDRHANLFLDHGAAMTINQLHFMLPLVALAAMISLEFYALVLLASLFVGLIWKTEQLLERKIE